VKFTVTAPDGGKITVEAPDGPSAVALAQKHYRMAPPTAVPVSPPAGNPQLHMPTQQDPRVVKAREFLNEGVDGPPIGPFGKPGSGEPMRQFTRQVTMGLTEPVGAAMYAGEQALGNLVTGKPVDFGKNYDAMRVAQLERTAENEGPVNTAAGVAGAVASPVPFAKFIKGAASLKKGAPLAARALQFAGRAGRAGAVGAGVGGISGGANAPSAGDIPMSTVEGAAYGGAMAPFLYAGGEGLAAAGGGPVGQFLTGGVRRLGGGVAGVTAAAKNAVTGELPSVTPKAAERGDRQAHAYLQRRFEQRGVTPEQLAQHPDIGRGITVAEAAGPTFVQEQVGLSKRPGLAGDLAFDKLTARNRDLQERLQGDIEHHTRIPVDLARGGVDAVVAKGRKDVAPIFEQALSSPGPVWNLDFANLAKRPAIEKAIEAAVASMKNAGLEPLRPGFALDADTGQKLTGEDLKSLIEMQPTAKAWDLVRKKVESLVERDKVTGQVIQTGKLGEFNKNLFIAGADLSAAMREAVPHYSTALDMSGDYLKVQDAADRAANMLFNKKHTAQDVAELMASLKSDGERNAVRATFARQLYDKSDAGDLRPSLFQGVGGGTRNLVRDKLATVFGNDAADGLISGVEAESRLLATGTRMKPLQNSTTGEAAAMAAEHDAASGDEVARLLGRRDMKGAVLSAFGAPFRAALEGGSSPGSLAFRNGLTQLLMMSPEDLPAALKALPPDVGILPGPGGQPPETRGLLPARSVAPAASLLGQQRAQERVRR
jgi:hypothetical protein